jgi:hypothetical protein
MAIIYSYPVASAVEAGDLVIGTDITGKQTKNFTLQSIADLVGLQGLQSVLDTGTTWTSADGFGTFTIDPGNGDGYISYKNTDDDWGYTLSAEEGFYFTDANGNEQGYSAIPGFGGIIVGNTTHSTAITSDNITANRNLYLPDASGTIALTSDITSQVTGTGTTQTLPVWSDGPNGALGDSWIYQNLSPYLPSGKQVYVAADLYVSGEVRLQGPLIAPESTFWETTFQNIVKDKFDSPGYDGQVLTSTGDGVRWKDVVDGTVTTQTLPIWSDGPNGVLGDSAIKQHNGNNITIGSNPSAASQGNYTLSVGNDNDFASGTARVLAVGASNIGTLTDVVDSAVIGINNEIAGSYSLTVGQRNQTNSGTSFVAGVDNVTSSGVPRQFVIGRDNTVDSIDTIVLGDRNIVAETGDGFGSILVFGHLNDVKGDRILCLGTSNIVNSDNQGAYIIGAGSSSTADRTYSVGQQNAITGNESYAFGKSNTIAASASVAVGTNNSISAVEKAYAFGFGNDNINFKSFAIGDNNDVLSAQRTYLIGRENKPATDNTIILGQFSDPTVLRTNNINGRSTVAFGVGVNNGIRRTAWEFRGKPTSTGDTSAGDSMQIMAWALLYSTSYADDTAAAAGGVEVGQLYRTGSTVKIRMT